VKKKKHYGEGARVCEGETALAKEIAGVTKRRNSVISQEALPCLARKKGKRL